MSFEVALVVEVPTGIACVVVPITVCMKYWYKLFLILYYPASLKPRYLLYVLPDAVGVGAVVDVAALVVVEVPTAVAGVVIPTPVHMND